MSDRDGVRLVGFVDNVRIENIRIDGVKLADEFRDYVTPIDASFSGSFDIESDAYDTLVEMIGGRPRPTVDLNVITRKPQLVLRHRRDGWRSRLRFLVVAETYKGATIESVEI